MYMYIFIKYIIISLLLTQLPTISFLDILLSRLERYFFITKYYEIHLYEIKFFVYKKM